MIMSDTKLPNTYRLGLFGEKYREGLADGKAEGKAEGEAEGRLKEAREFVVFVLQQRGIKVTESMRSRIDSYDDPEKLRSIAGRAMSTYNVSDIFYDSFD
jgi:flagellar biosynthesis/type III secretory pathway protein FliH